MTEEGLRNAGGSHRRISVRDGFPGKVWGRCSVDDYFEGFLGTADGFLAFLSGISTSKESSVFYSATQ